MVCWPWLAVVVMMIFRASMRRASDRAIHQVRVVIYISDFAVWLGLAWAIAVILLALPMLIPQAGASRIIALKALEPLAFVVPLVALMALTYRLGIAMRQYLRFRHAMWMAISVNVILVLATMVVAVQIAQARRGW